ncbi:hypothetical protein [Saccharothrix sp. ST-888]|uniref:hypothetical protein n=1 Tax=Saccharothrix sp. ST-888 TaxID=1427391 RepID=UPI0005ECEC82|nr:hypothetical protein [Saccharothrix sp. ST-888]KJK56125.1 hypothetical protein UK12_24610 [Saccharothrix sp. ST-888]
MAIRIITDDESRSHKAGPVRVDYRGKVNLRGARAPEGGRANQAPAVGRNVRHQSYTGKQLKAPKRVIRSSRPAGYQQSPTYAPGSHARGMGYSTNGGYFSDGPSFDLTTVVGMRAARDFWSGIARGLEEQGQDASHVRAQVANLRRVLKEM